MDNHFCFLFNFLLLAHLVALFKRVNNVHVLAINARQLEFDWKESEKKLCYSNGVTMSHPVTIYAGGAVDGVTGGTHILYSVDFFLAQTGQI